MKLFVNFFDKIQNRPSYNFFLNLIFLKQITIFSLKQLNYIQLFFKIKNFLKLKIFKFNYSIYNYFILYFITFNLIAQIILIILSGKPRIIRSHSTGPEKYKNILFCFTKNKFKKIKYLNFYLFVVGSVSFYNRRNNIS